MPAAWGKYIHKIPTDRIQPSFALVTGLAEELEKRTVKRVGNRRHKCSFDLHDDELPFGTREGIDPRRCASNALSKIVSSWRLNREP